MQARVSKSLGGGFEGHPKDVWGCVDYTDRKKPCVFVGMYDLRDYYYLWRHKGKAYIFWCGGDLYNLDRGFILNDGKLKWISKIPFTRNFILKIIKKAENWVENGWEEDILLKYNIASFVCPSFFGDVSKYKITYKYSDKPKVYLSCGKGKQEKYGFNKIEWIADRVPEVEFHLYGDTWSSKYPNVFCHGRVPIEQMNAEISQMQCGLRLNKHDGFSEITAKSILWGQYPITNIKFPMITNYRSFNYEPSEFDIINLLKDLKNYKEPNIKGRDYYLKVLNNFPFNEKSSIRRGI